MDVDGISIAKAQEIADASIVSGEINGSGHLVLTNAGGTEFNAGLVVPGYVQVSIESFVDPTVTVNWSPDPDAKLLHIQAIGGGGGGASGWVTGGDNASGAGGGGGGFNELWVPASAFAAYPNCRIDVGDGGLGGVGNGQDGAVGEATDFWVFDGGSHRSIVLADGGHAGLHENPSLGLGSGGGAAGNIFASAGAPGRGDFGVPPGAASALRGGGGGGGGVNLGGAVIQSGGAGGFGGGGASPPTDSTGTLPLYQALLIGGGGGMGGAANTAAPIARAGSNGGLYGGGGGGGAGVNLNAGNGGNGAKGIVVIISYF